jgi:hypothetical protein
MYSVYISFSFPSRNLNAFCPNSSRSYIVIFLWFPIEMKPLKVKTHLTLIVKLKREINGALSRINAAETKLLPSKWLPAKTGRCYTNVCRCKLKVRPRAEISSQFICIFTAPYYYLKPPVQTLSQCDSYIMSTERDRQKLGQSFSCVSFGSSWPIIRYLRVYLEWCSISM